jgi:hypothetical protein
MTDEAISPLRRRMIEDMTIRKLAPKTRQGYGDSSRDEDRHVMIGLGSPQHSGQSRRRRRKT